MTTPRPDTNAILAQLKDFQRDTVDYVFRRMYLDNDCVRRFLVADEVGLGKTLIARGVVAKAIDHLWTQTDRIDVIYVCSNADIARQNIQRLNITGKRDFQLASRITLLPVNMQKVGQQRLNFVSFTPATSFEQAKGSGLRQERVLLYWMLRRIWDFSEAKATRVLEGWALTENFRKHVASFSRASIHEGIAEGFAERLSADPYFQRRFEELCDAAPRAGISVTIEARRDTERYIGELRKLLAQTCLQWLEPDIIILDEFQRFKHLLSEGSEAGGLAHELFGYQQSNDNAASGARVLLLSATPYKMYTMSHESGQDDHYADFQATLDFLLTDDHAKQQFHACIKNYREALYRLPDQGAASLIHVKSELEGMLRRVMVRTERLAIGADRNGMLRVIESRGLELGERDVEQYLAVQRVARALGHEDVLEYWKSAPFLLNFMEEYELKRKLDRTMEGKSLPQAFLAAMEKAGPELLSPKDIASYHKIDPANARLRCLLHDTIDRGAWKLLWVPPSLPYYAFKGPFANPELERFTKRLVFSCWRVVPKAIAAMVSYEAERRMMHAYRKKARNTLQARKKRRPLLRFTTSKGRLTGMPALMLTYPCRFLAESFDPLRMAGEQLAAGILPTSSQLLSSIKHSLQSAMAPLLSLAAKEGPVDESWYWAAPVLLDLEFDRVETSTWLHTPGLENQWGLPKSKHEENSRKGWRHHIDEARRALVSEKFIANLGPPPEDLLEILARLAMAGPAVCALRTLQRLTTAYGRQAEDLRTPAGALGHAVLHLFNLPEVTAYVRDRKGDVPYWKQTLRYCLARNFQAMLDEYGHLLGESENLAAQRAQSMAESISTTMQEALLLRTSTAQADVVRVKRGTVGYGKPLRMRTRFAMRFGDQSPEQGSEPTRADHVRSAFNSPFWPFILATTSVGQEGLDFHPYCHAVVHWNLPSNPVDLEQREGRIHRYKGHALRKNLAKAFAASISKGNADPWTALFAAAKAGRAVDHTDLYPYWICDEGDAKIERHVPSLPHSREIVHHENLRRSLVLYRMVFGQSRQEDIVEYLKSRLTNDEQTAIAQTCRIDLSPPRSSSAGMPGNG